MYVLYTSRYVAHTHVTDAMSTFCLCCIPCMYLHPELGIWLEQRVFYGLVNTE